MEIKGNNILCTSEAISYVKRKIQVCFQHSSGTCTPRLKCRIESRENLEKEKIKINVTHDPQGKSNKL